METPKEIKEHEEKYHSKAWTNYTAEELGCWIHLFLKRSYHRKEQVKKLQDITNARNYWHMLGCYIDNAENGLSSV